MAQLNFPNSPSVGDTYPTTGDSRYRWDGTAWRLIVSESELAGTQLGFLAPGHDDHSGGENDGEIILGNSQGDVISALPVDVRANSTIIEGDNGLIGTDNGRIVYNVSTVVQADDERPVNSAGVKTYVDTAIGNLPPGHDNIGGLLSITSTPDKVAEIGIYDTDSARIGQQFVISTVNSVNDIQDITINSEPASGTSTTQLAQRLEITLNKATSIVDGELRVPTTQAVLDYVTSIETDPVTTANVRAVLQDDSGVGGISWSIDSGSNKIIGVANIGSKADTATTVIDADIGLNDDNQVVSIRVGDDVRNIAGGGSEIAALVLNQAYLANEAFTLNNNIYVVNADTSGFADNAAAIAGSTSILDGNAGPAGTGQTAQQVQTAITGRLNDGAGTSEDSDQAYTTTETDRLLSLKPDDAVLYTEQTLTNAQQIQARANIAASRQTELWATGQNYVVGDNVLVVFSGDIIGFACLQAHTSDNTPGGTGNGQPRINVDNSNWQQIGFQNIIPWVTGFAWQAGDVVLYRDLTPNNLSNSGLYIRRVGGVDTDSSQNPFVNTADWLPLGGSGGGIEVLSSDPSSPTDGQVWYNSSQEIIKYFDGELTLDIAKFLGYFSTDPTHSSANHSDGDMWYNTTENEFKYFSGSGVVHTIITNLDSITALSDGQAVLDSIATETSNREAADTTLQNNIDAEATTRAEDDAIEAVAREAGDEAERDFVETTLHVDAADSQSYYQFSGQPAIFSEVPATDYGITIAMPQTIEDTEELVQAENIGETTKVFKLTLRYGDGANDTKQYVVTTGGYNFTISDERTSETYTLPSIEGTYVAASVHQNGTSTRRQDCFLAIGGWFGRIAQVDMAHVLNVSNGDILTGRTLELGQDYSEHIIADNNNTAVVGLVFDNQTTGSHTGINAYTLQRHNRIVRYRAAASGGLFSFRNGNSVVDRFNPSRVPNVVETNQVEESNWLGLKLVTIQNAISATAANGDGNRLTYAVGDKMLVAFGEAVASTSAGIFVPGIATTKNPSTFAGGNVNLGLFYTGGEDPSEEYSNYSGSGSNNNEADFNAHIYDFEYSNASGAWTFFFGGQTVGETAIATSAAGFHGTSIWNMASISDATRAGAGGIIRSINLGGNIAGLASSTHFWITTELGALWVNTTPWLASGYGSDALVQAHTNPNDPTSDVKRDFTFRGFQYFDQHGSIGAGDDGHIYRLVINPEVTFTVTFGNVTHTARYRFNDDTADMHAFFGNPASYSPTLAGTGVSLITTAPGGEPSDQLYLDYSVNGQNTPVVSYQWVGVLSTTDDDFETYSPFRRIDLANTVVDIHYPDGGATYHIPMSSNINDYTVGGEANGAVDQMVAAVNTHTAQGHSAVRVDAGFADTITNTKPVLRLDQTGTHALQNAPTVTIAHPSGQNTGDLAVVRFADGGYDTIGRPGGLFDPNDYDTRAEQDAKIAAIASTHGYAENIVPNAGSGNTTYTRLDRLQVGTEIFDVSTDAAQVESFFADSSASRGVSYSESNGVITTTVAADTSKQDVINASNRLPTVNIGTGAINNSELNTLNGIDVSQTIQAQLDSKAGTVFEGFQNAPTGDPSVGRVLKARVSDGTELEWADDLSGAGSGGSALKGIITSTFTITSIVGGGNATWTDANGLSFTSTTTPDDTKVYRFNFSHTGSTVFEFNGADVQFVNSIWTIHPIDITFTTGNKPSNGANLAFNSVQSADIYTGPISLGSTLTLTNEVLNATGADVPDAFKYSQLLTSGFLMLEVPAEDVGTREAFRDTTGAYGTVNQLFWFSDTDGSWYDVASGGTALVTFID